jgi:hypothetical protein
MTIDTANTNSNDQYIRDYPYVQSISGKQRSNPGVWIPISTTPNNTLRIAWGASFDQSDKKASFNFYDHVATPSGYNYGPGRHIATVQAPNGTYPDNGRAGDGYFYVKTSVVNAAPSIGISTSGNRYVSGSAGAAPTVTVSGSANDPNGDTLLVKANLGGVEKTASIVPGSWQFTWSYSELPEGSQSLMVHVDDGYGGTASASYSGSIIVDKTAPSAPSVSLSESGFTAKNVTVTVTEGQDNYSGVLKSQYRIGNSGAWTDYTGPFQVTQEGVTTVYARTVDRAGNISDEASAVAKIIRTKPSKPLVSLSIMDWTNQDIKVGMAHSNNPNEGISYKMQYKIGDSGTWTDFQSPFMFGEEGVKIYGRVVDTAGNISDETVAEPRIDRTAPTEPVIQSELNPSGIGASITVTPGTDALSGVSKTEYKLGDQGTWTDYVSTLTVSLQDTVTVYARTTDRVGNVSIEAVETIEASMYEKALAEAIKAVEKAEASRLQSDINAARSLVSDLKSADQQPLLERLNQIQIIPDVPQDPTKPLAPVGLIGTNVTPTSIKLAWKAAKDDAGRVSYEIYDGGQLVGETRELFYELNNLNPQQSYVFTVKAKDAAGNYSDPSNAVSKGVSKNYRYIYDAAGRLDKIELDGKLLFDYQYDKNGNLLQIVPNP